MTNGPTLKTASVPLTGNRILFVGLSRDVNNQPEDIVLAVGFNASTAIATLMADGIAVPAEAVPALRKALNILLEDSHESR